MDEFNDWLMALARRNTRTVYCFELGDWQTTCFGYPSIPAWLNSLTNDDLQQYYLDMENEKCPPRYSAEVQVRK